MAGDPTKAIEALKDLGMSSVDFPESNVIGFKLIENGDVFGLRRDNFARKMEEFFVAEGIAVTFKFAHNEGDRAHYVDFQTSPENFQRAIQIAQYVSHHANTQQPFGPTSKNEQPDPQPEESSHEGPAPEPAGQEEGPDDVPHTRPVSRLKLIRGGLKKLKNGLHRLIPEITNRKAKFDPVDFRRTPEGAIEVGLRPEDLEIIKKVLGEEHPQHLDRIAQVAFSRTEKRPTILYKSGEVVQTNYRQDGKLDSLTFHGDKVSRDFGQVLFAKWEAGGHSLDDLVNGKISGTKEFKKNAKAAIQFELGRRNGLLAKNVEKWQVEQANDPENAQLLAAIKQRVDSGKAPISAVSAILKQPADAPHDFAQMAESLGVKLEQQKNEIKPAPRIKLKPAA